jgi:hypothetical protein
MIKPMSKTSAVVIVGLLAVIAVLSWLLVVKQAEAPSVQENIVVTPTPSPSPTPATSASPLHERVSITSPKANASDTKVFSVTGQAPGNWFFEASAPIMVVDPEGNKLAQSYIQAEGDWMTTELVSFKGEIRITSSYAGPATLVLMKDNPSGLPEHDDSLEISLTIQ